MRGSYCDASGGGPRYIRLRDAGTAAVTAASARVSVITPAHNVACYVGHAIDSVLAQSFKDFEYLVVDDGSTDGTADEVRRHAGADRRVRLICQPHGGAARARNAGLAQAAGQFIAFLDGDDRWHADFLERQLAVLLSAGPDVAAVFARSRVMSERGRVYLLRWQRSGRYDYDDMLVKSCPPRVGSSLVIKKAAFDAAGVFSEAATVQDLDMWLRIQRDSGMPFFVGNGRYLLDIRVRPGAISRDHARRFEALDALIAEHAQALTRHRPGMAYVRAAVFAYRAGAEDHARRWTREARQVGARGLLSDSYGWRLLGWSSLAPGQRRLLRRCNAGLRLALGRMLGQAGGLLR